VGPRIEPVIDRAIVEDLGLVEEPAFVGADQETVQIAGDAGIGARAVAGTASGAGSVARAVTVFAALDDVVAAHGRRAGTRVARTGQARADARAVALFAAFDEIVAAHRGWTRACAAWTGRARAEIGAVAFFAGLGDVVAADAGAAERRGGHLVNTGARR